MNCPACHREINSEPIHSYKDYQYYHCANCDLMFWYPMKNPGTDWYEASLVPTPFRPVWLAHWGQRQFLRATPTRGGQLLDIGCGLGDFLFKAQQAGYSVTGIDLSPNCIKVASQRFGIKNLYPMTLEEFVTKHPHNKYDVITFFEVLEHLDNVSDFLSQVKMLLKPGGYIACSVPNRAKWRFSSIIEECDYPPNHFTHWSPRSLSNLFGKYGFSILTLRPQPLISYDHGWFYQVSTKLGIQQMGRLVVKRFKPVSSVPSNASATIAPNRGNGTVIKWGIVSYVKFVLPALGVLTLPLWVLLRRQGSVIYLLATMKETK